MNLVTGVLLGALTLSATTWRLPRTAEVAGCAGDAGDASASGAGREASGAMSGSIQRRSRSKA